MRRNLVSILICPKCKGNLELREEKGFKGRIQKGELKCEKCGNSFQIIDDIICFSSFSKKGLDKKIRKTQQMFLDQEVSKKWLKYFNKEELVNLKNEWQWLIDNLGLKNSKIHLEWAVGTGRFLRNILKICKGEIIAMEIDYATCVGLRAFLKKIKAYSKVTIICADAQRMPLADNSIDSASCWHGLDEPNISKALNESKRVLRKNKTLGVSGLFFEEKSKSLKEALRLKIKFAKERGAYQYFKKLGFREIRQKIFFRGKWEKGASFLPKKGDKYTSYAIVGKK